MSFSDRIENEALDHIFGGPDYTRAATLYIGLSTSDPGEAAAGLNEPSGGAYARVSMINSSNLWDAAAGGIKRNTGALSFPEATASWGSVTHVGVWDNPSSDGAGAFLGSGVLGTAKNIVSGDTPRFPANSLSITLD